MLIYRVSSQGSRIVISQIRIHKFNNLGSRSKKCLIRYFYHKRLGSVTAVSINRTSLEVIWISNNNSSSKLSNHLNQDNKSSTRRQPKSHLQLSKKIPFNSMAQIWVNSLKITEISRTFLRCKFRKRVHQDNRVQEKTRFNLQMTTSTRTPRVDSNPHLTLMVKICTPIAVPQRTLCSRSNRKSIKSNKQTRFQI